MIKILEKGDLQETEVCLYTMDGCSHLESGG